MDEELDLLGEPLHLQLVLLTLAIQDSNQITVNPTNVFQVAVHRHLQRHSLPVELSHLLRLVNALNGCL